MAGLVLRARKRKHQDDAHDVYYEIEAAYSDASRTYSMSNGYEKRAEDWLSWVLERLACQWCRNRDRAIYRKSLCRPCYDIRLELRRLHKRVVSANAKYGRGRWPNSTQYFLLQANYITALNMAESAQILGRAHEGHLRSASTLDCEHIFRSLSGRFLKRDLFVHDAYRFECFSPVHRRYLYYLVDRMMQQFYSLNRRSMSRRFVLEYNTIEDALTHRSHGTYRVEDDV